MRIISKFRDYYDSAMVHGSDPAIVYAREPSDGPEELIDLLKLEEALAPGRHGRYGYFYGSLNESETDGNDFLRLFYVIFCGKLYPGLHFFKWDKHVKQPHMSGGHVESYHYDLDEFKVVAADYLRKKRNRWDDATVRTRVVEGHFSRRVDGLMDWCVVNRHGIYTIYSGCLGYYRQAWAIQANGPLDGLAFYRAVDAWQAYQELSMWYGGIVPREGAEMVQVSDKVRAEKHGMDKWSFRKKVR